LPRVACSVTQRSVPAVPTRRSSDLDSQAVALGANGTAFCTIANASGATVTLTKTYSDGSTTAVAGFTLTCSRGSIAPSATQNRTGGGTVSWTVSGFSAGASCSVTESTVPGGYVQTGNTCTTANLGLPAGAA